MEKKHNLFKLNCFVSFLLLHSSFFLYHLLLHLSSSSLHFSPFVLSSLSLLSHQSPEPKGSDSQPTPVTNRELLGSHLTADRLGGSVQVLGNELNTVFILSFPFSLVLFFPHSFFFFCYFFCTRSLLSQVLSVGSVPHFTMDTAPHVLFAETLLNHA